MDKELKKILRAILKRGWRRLPGGKHHVVQHIESGRKVSFSMSPSDGHAPKQFGRDIARIEREAALKEAA